jgi:hypothetical protein
LFPFLLLQPHSLTLLFPLLPPFLFIRMFTMTENWSSYYWLAYTQQSWFLFFFHDLIDYPNNSVISQLLMSRSIQHGGIEWSAARGDGRGMIVK